MSAVLLANYFLRCFVNISANGQRSVKFG